MFKRTIQPFISKVLFAIAAIINGPIDRLRLFFLHFSIRHIHGPGNQGLDLATAHEAVVLCVVKNGQTLIKPFIDHYLNLGFKHIFFLDNGSSDTTVDIIKSYSQTTLLLSNKPFRQYQVVFKNFLIQTFGRGRWCVVADIDEFLHLPMHRSLENILAYLNKNNYDTVAVQMLEMFSKEDIKLKEQQGTWTSERLRSVYCYYDLTNINKEPYVRSLLSRSHPFLKFLFGGIRKTVFGLDCFLTKEAMFLGCRSTYLKSSHLLAKAKVADFSALFLHYKFIEDFYAYTLKAVEEENHWRNSKEYKAYFKRLSKQDELVLFQPSSLELTDIDDLIDQQFLVVSSTFRDACYSYPEG